MLLSGYGQENQCERTEVAGTQGGAGALLAGTGKKERSNLRHHQQAGTRATARPRLDHTQTGRRPGRGTQRVDEGRGVGKAAKKEKESKADDEKEARTRKRSRNGSTPA